MEQNLEGQNKSTKSIYEYCTVCNCLYSLNGRKQHLKTKKHAIQLMLNDLNPNDDSPIEHYSLREIEEIEIN